MKGFQKGDPRAAAAGRKGGQTMRAKQTPDYRRGFQAGYQAGRREARAWIAHQRARDASQADAS